MFGLPMSGSGPDDGGLTERISMTTPHLLWILPALALLACGWFASARFYQRKIDTLQGQVKAVRQTAAEHASQARRQIGQLQAELAARPSAPPAQRAARAAPTATTAAAAAAEARRAAVEKLVPDHGFAPTAIAAHGFAKTQVMETSPAGAR